MGRAGGGRLGGRGWSETQLLQRFVGNIGPEVVLLPPCFCLVGRGNGLEKGPMNGDVWIDFLPRHELELVDDALVVRVRHGQEDSFAAHQYGKNSMALGDFGRHDVEMVKENRHLREVDPGYAVLFGEGTEGFDLVDLAVFDQS